MDELYHHISDFLVRYKLEYRNLDKLPLLTRYITESIKTTITVYGNETGGSQTIPVKVGYIPNS